MTDFPGGGAKRRRGVGMALCLLVASITLPGTVGVSPAHAGLGPPFLLHALHSDKVVDVPGGSVQPGTQLVQWTEHGGTNQELFAVSFGNNVFALFLVGSGMAIDVAGGSTADGAPIIQWPWHGGLNQLWVSVPFTPDSTYVVFVSVGSGKVLDVAGASKADGAPLVQWTWHGGQNQIWSGETVPD